MRKNRKAGRITYLLASFIVAFSASSNFGLKLAEAVGNGGYPWWQAKASGYLSDWYMDENGNGRFDGLNSSESYDPYGFAYRNCTSYVAWKLASLGFTVPYGQRLGNANTWDDNARRLGFSVDTAPRPGDVAVWNGGHYGHVAFVESVNNHGSQFITSDDTVNISEYNAVPVYKGMYSNRQDIKASVYIHFLPANQTEPVTPEPVVLPTPSDPAAKPAPQVETISASSTGAANSAAAIAPVGAAVNPTPDYSNADYLMADISGDNHSDLVTISPHVGGGSDVFWQLAQPGAGFAPLQYLLTPTGNANDTKWLSGDVNGDGKADIIAYSQTNSQISIMVLASSATGLAPAATWGAFNNLGTANNIIISDQDGDKKQDLIILTKQSGKSPNILWLRSTGTSFTSPTTL